MTEISGPFDRVGIRVNNRDSTIRFTIDMDSVDISARSIVGQVTDGLPVKDKKENRAGDVRVIMDEQRMTTSHISELMDNISEAESDGVEFYNVRIGI